MNLDYSGVKTILSQALSPDLITLRGRAMECAGIFGEASGGRFEQDALEIMNLLISAMVSILYLVRDRSYKK